MTDSGMASRTRSPAESVTGKTFVTLVVASSVWITICLVMWLVPPVFTFGGFALMTVGWVVFGPFLGMIASLVVAGFLMVLPNAMPRMLAVMLASVVAWSVALLAWFAVGFSVMEAEAIVVSCLVAFVGCAISIVITWPRHIP